MLIFGADQVRFGKSGREGEAITYDLYGITHMSYNIVVDRQVGPYIIMFILSNTSNTNYILKQFVSALQCDDTV